MKLGCSLQLLGWLVLSACYWFYLKDTSLGDKWWIGILLGLTSCMVIASIVAIAMVMRMARASRRPQKDWRDGDLVGISGRIRAVRDPFEAPFSGKQAVILEYEVSHISRGSKNERVRSQRMSGMRMVPCVVDTPRGSLRIIGFPLMAQMHFTVMEGIEQYERAASFIENTTFKEAPKSPLKLLADLERVLEDDDGEVLENFGFEKLREPEDPPLTGDSLMSNMIELQEKLVENGAQVTIFGTFRKNKSAVDVGSGFKNIKHQLHLGPLDKTLPRERKKAYGLLILWTVLAVVGHYGTAKALGLV